MYFWQIAEDKNYLSEEQKKTDLHKTLKTVLSKLRNICKTEEYNSQTVCIGYLFEHIRPSLISLIGLFTDPKTKQFVACLNKPGCRVSTGSPIP